MLKLVIILSNLTIYSDLIFLLRSKTLVDPTILLAGPVSNFSDFGLLMVGLILSKSGSPMSLLVAAMGTEITTSL